MCWRADAGGSDLLFISRNNLCNKNHCSSKMQTNPKVRAEKSREACVSASSQVDVGVDACRGARRVLSRQTANVFTTFDLCSLVMLGKVSSSVH